ncbi:tetratricopeptide repeat protein [Ammonifex thiophilus]|uniref:Uncharacterized protein n=1 Tax=Ammonifex thiophilus TaxID=444093 RepID=A0A3D8P7C9_9THEO|nr:tetratricopeptide repeat protein [Ammonifex thiophilus]RDV84558.1 hypothetical protein DXX99_00430 [Ammonifex thiophilus]
MFWLKLRGRGSKLILGFLALVLSVGLIVSTFTWFSLPPKLPEAPPSPERAAQASQASSWQEEFSRAVAQKDLAKLLELGAKAREEGKLAEATRVYEEVLKLFPDSTNARLSLAEIYLAEEKYDAAYQQVEAVLQENPNHQLALFYRGLILGYGKKDYSAAVRDLEKFLKLAPDAPEAWQARILIEEWSKH